MIHCSEITDIEDFVLGTLPPRRVRELRAHLGTCRECQREEALLVRERALFARREELASPLSAVVAAQLRERLDVEAAKAPVIDGGRLRRLGARGVAMMGAAAACGAMWALLHGGAPASTTTTSPGAVTRIEGPSVPIVSHSRAPTPTMLSCGPPELPPLPPLPAEEMCEDSVESHVETVACMIVVR